MPDSPRPDMASPLRSTLTGHEHGIWSLATAVVEGRPVAVTGGHDETVRIWDLSDGRPVGGPLVGHNGLIRNGEVWAVATAVVDGRPVALSGGGSNLIQMWDLAAGLHMGEPLDDTVGQMCAVATTVVGGRPVAVTGHADGAVRVWDLAGRKQIGEPLPGHTGWVEAVATAVVGGRPVAVTGGNDRSVRVWDLTERTQIGGPLEVHTNEVRAVSAAVIDGRAIAVTGDLDGTVRVWDLATGRPAAEPLDVRSEVGSVTTTAVGSRLIALVGSGDGTVRVWDPITGQPIGEPLKGHEGMVWGAATAVVDGRTVAVTGGNDRTVRVWDLTHAVRQEPMKGLLGRTERKTFQTHLRQAATAILERVPDQLKREIYVLAFNIWRVDADHRRPCVGIGYNTESRYEEQSRGDSDHWEVRWNYAFWILEGFDKLGNVPEDPVGAPLHEEEARNLGIWYDGEFDLALMLADAGLRTKSRLLELHFHDAVIDLARHLHASGTIERVFGRPLPVVVFDMDCPGWEEEATRAANPAALIEDFLA